ncbi:Cyclin-like protein [Hirsutella rhossiliensis]|uniref:Cyclin-like protein n=1 Tax=Hirsutella rhossiliensis TaxID=111463 RepID=A0A9P8N6J9_9HYPO|nr:Cyclin-like protein [Hirsutella rhossiliensis]KAH0965577.1 Cyclin-like protein [Hirsutella rhossiliensis]
MQRPNKPQAIALASHHSAKLHDDNDDDDQASSFKYLTYRPLSNLPTPPPTYKETTAAAAAGSPPTPTTLEDGEPLQARFLGPAIHLVNLIPSSASLATASVTLVQGMLSRADLPLETVALAVCVLDSLDSKFARAWRLCCPLLPSAVGAVPSLSKRHTLSTSLLYQAQQQQMLHIDSVKPELIILAALVIAVKFTQDPQQPTQFYCLDWGKAVWSHRQLNATERCIMESLNYRIMPLCDEDYLADAMVDMQLAAQQRDAELREQTPPVSVSSSDDDAFVPGHSRSKTAVPSVMALGPRLPPNLVASPVPDM